MWERVVEGQTRWGGGGGAYNNIRKGSYNNMRRGICTYIFLDVVRPSLLPFFSGGRLPFIQTTRRYIYSIYIYICV